MATIYSDVFSSITRRQRQDAKDAAELAEPVQVLPRVYTDGNVRGPFWNLRAYGAVASLEPGRSVGRGPKHSRYNDRLARRKAKAVAK